MKRMILVDGNSLMYRAYYGMAGMGSLTQTSKGLYTNAIYSFARMVNTLVSTPYDAILVAFDAGKKTFRHEIMTDYKAGRKSMPDEMRMQIEFIKQYLDIMRIKRLEIPLFEADDIIGTMARKGKEDGYHVDIYSSDKDLLQLVDENITVNLTKKGMTDLAPYTPVNFKDLVQVEKSQFLDLKALMGDKSDNLPGIPRIGEKKAIKYLLQYGSLDEIIAHKDEIGGADGENIRQYYEQAILCKKMATISTEVPLSIGPTDIAKKDKNIEQLIEFYQTLEFTTLLKEMARTKPLTEEKISFKVVELIDLKSILLPNSAVLLETSDMNYHKSPLLGIGLVNETGAYIIPIDLLYQSVDLQLYLADKNIAKLTYDAKKSYVLLKRLGFDLNGIIFDLMLAAYVLNPVLGKEEFKTIVDSFHPTNAKYDEEVYGRGVRKAIPNEEIIYDHIIRKCQILFDIKTDIIEKLEANEQLSLLVDVEIPLSLVLAKMEFQGLKIDQDELDAQKTSLEERILILENEIQELCGKSFNIGSPKQLGTVLFDDLKLPYPKKNTKGSYSTDIDILNSLKTVHPVIDKIMEYRSLTKLNSTYITGIKGMIHPDGKVHTIFQQALTQTGRLSSIEPNLQNIPIRTDEGHLVRKLFVPHSEDYVFYSADYSQIELRVLAHMANVKRLQEAFRGGEDIHTDTAQAIFDVEDVTPLQRRQAKAVNFGIIYGQSPFGLAQELGISNFEAAEFIKKYNAIYPEIDEFMKNTIEFCKEEGYVKTLKNRKRFIPDIHSKVYMQREFAKRTAMNAPIQGSAADIIKIAMIAVDEELAKNQLHSFMVLSVHDEIVLEVKKGEEDQVQAIVKKAMEGAIELSVPLLIDDAFGKNWYEVK